VLDLEACAGLPGEFSARWLSSILADDEAAPAEDETRTSSRARIRVERAMAINMQVACPAAQSKLMEKTHART
jgi:hypothetical protein